MRRIRFRRHTLIATMLLLAAASLAITTAAADEPAVENRGENEVVLIHTIGSSAACWDDVAARLSEFYDVRVYELPGHGDTPPIEDLTIDSAAAHLESWIAANGLVYPVVVGHGMGGLIAMRHAFSHPNDVKKLVLIDSAPRQFADKEQKLQVTEQLLENYDRFVASYYLNMSGIDSVANRMADQALRTDRASFTQLLMSSFDFDYTAELGISPIPLLVVGSGFFFPDSSSEGATETLGRLGFGAARTLNFKTMPNIGHFVMVEQPDFLSSVIVAFMLGH